MQDVYSDYRMNRDQTQTILRELARQHGCEYVQPDEDVMDMIVQFAEMVENGCADKLHVNTKELLLMAGEMTAQEIRTTKAVLACLSQRFK